MKLPFDFGIKLIFRLVIPGFLLSLGFLPIMNAGLDVFGWTARFDYAFLTAIVLLGWLITISDMSIYMLLEGRRWWPAPIKRFCIDRHEARLRKLIERSKSTDDLIAGEAYFDLPNFPMNNDGEYYVAYPSRLGNLLRAFELYSLRTYGIDSIFYWWRIWLRLDKDSREEVDNSQALADSTTYACFSLYFSGLLMLLYLGFKIMKAIALVIAPGISSYLPKFIVVLDAHLPRKAVAATLAAIFFVAGLLVYRLSLYLHAQFGELFKSVIDLNIGKINLSSVLKRISDLSESSASVVLARRLPRTTQFAVAARYLQFYRYRCPNPNCNALLKPNEIADHECVEFRIFREPSGSWRWRAETTTGRRILLDYGAAYESEEDCMKDIQMVKQSSDAPVEEEKAEPPP